MLQVGCLVVHVCRVLALLVPCLVCLWARPAAALDRADVPAPLLPWVPWVLEQRGDAVCPKLGETAACVWPGRLELELAESGGRFRMGVLVDQHARVPLPGGEQQWPQDVTVDGKAAAVMQESAPGVPPAPVALLAPGTHTLEGRFVWHRQPETLLVPARIALLELTVKGQRVAQPRRDAERVWLKGEQAAAEEPESLTLELFRKLEDQVPFSVETLLSLQVSGRSRELRLPTALLGGSLPIELVSQLPARIEPNGELLLQVYPGRHELRLTALYPRPPERLSAPRHAPPGPKQEIWVFVPHTEQRQTELSGGSSVDPQRTNLPESWRGFAAYQLGAGTELTFQSLRRGQPQPQPNRLSLERELWLDLDGQGYTVRDRLSGTMDRSWRLDLLQGELGHAAVSGVDQLITVHPASSARGVELRQGNVELSAEWRLSDARGTLPAVAWSEDMEQLGTSLHLPPGWQLLGVSGADSVWQSWLERWDLFALFFVLVVAVAVAKLERWAWGALALGGLLLAHGEPHAPRFVWVVILLCIALLEGLPAGRFRQLIRALGLATSLVLLGIVLSFGVTQIRAALYPQVSDAGHMFDVPDMDLATREVQEESAAPAMAPVAPPKRGEGVAGGLTQKSGVLPGAAYGSIAQELAQEPARNTLLEQDPNAQIQTGPGVPSWSWRTWRLGWSGPVEHTHSLTLYLLSPGVMAALSLLRLVLIGLLTFWALRRVWQGFRRPPAGGAVAVAAGLALLLGSVLTAAPAQADIPTPELLEQLKARIEPPLACDGVCLQVPRLSLEARDGELRVAVEAHASRRAALQLPGPVARWLPSHIELDGRAASALLLGDDGYLYVRLDPGVHRVSARGPIAGRQLTLDPGTPARWVTVDAPGWEVSGLSESGQIDGSLGFVRPLPADGASDPSDEAPSVLPSWSQLLRTFDLGVSWNVSTELRRVSPAGSLIVARVPLLPGERVTSAEVPVENGMATLRLAGDADSVRFESVLEPRPELALKAVEAGGYSERWVLRCSPIYRCQAEGLAPIQHVDSGRWQPVFAPWPGETLRLGVARPAAATGQTATIDSARLTLRPGVRLLRAELSATLRSSTQSRYALQLPDGSEVDQLNVDGKSEPIRQTGSQLELVLEPGQHALHVGWQEPGGLTALFRTPAVTLGTELSNAEVSVHLPDDRWLLAVGGPSWGPAILFWGHLLLILLLAPLLARVPRSPLRTWQWALLALGLTQVPLPVAGLVFGWFFAIAFQDRERPERPLWFNARQLLLLGFTLVFLTCLFAAVYDSLLNTPNMEVAGANSSERLLRWYVDRSPGTLPQAWVLTVSLWVWRGVMLLWALWLAHSLVGWLQWAWRLFSAQGVWRPRKRESAAQG